MMDDEQNLAPWLAEVSCKMVEASFCRKNSYVDMGQVRSSLVSKRPAQWLIIEQRIMPSFSQFCPLLAAACLVKDFLGIIWALNFAGELSHSAFLRGSSSGPKDRREVGSHQISREKGVAGPIIPEASGLIQESSFSAFAFAPMVPTVSVANKWICVKPQRSEKIREQISRGWSPSLGWSFTQFLWCKLI